MGNTSSGLVRVLNSQDVDTLILNKDFKEFIEWYKSIGNDDSATVRTWVSSFYKKRKSQIGKQDNSRKTLLDYAVEYDCKKLVKTILESNTSTLIEAKDFEKFITFYKSLPNDNSRHHIRSWLRKFYAENENQINTKDAQGATLLHYAVKYNCSVLAKRLLETGFDPSVRSQTYGTPFYLANQSEDKEALKAIQNHSYDSGLPQIKHAVYSLLSMDTAECDIVSKQHCVEGGWQPIQYLEFHIKLLESALKTETNGRTQTWIRWFIQNTQLTLDLERTTDLITARGKASQALEQGYPVTLRTGYLEPIMGHAIYVVFEKTTTGFEAKVCNLGDGSEHHPSTWQGFVPTVKYKFSNLPEALAYFENCFMNRNKNKKEAFSKIYPQDKAPEPCAGACVVQSQQTTGNCVVKNLLLAHAQVLRDLSPSEQYLFDNIYRNLLVTAVQLHSENGGNLSDLPTVNKVCEAAGSNQLSFLSAKDCAWITTNLPLQKTIETTKAPAATEPLKNIGSLSLNSNSLSAFPGTAGNRKTHPRTSVTSPSYSSSSLASTMAQRGTGVFSAAPPSGVSTHPRTNRQATVKHEAQGNRSQSVSFTTGQDKQPPRGFRYSN